jgi:MATE family multidrug resistance protein
MRPLSRPPAGVSEPSFSLAQELRALLTLAAPIAFAQVALMAMSLVDTAVLGHSSVEDLAGSSMANSIAFAWGSFGIGITIALEPLASQAVGAGEPQRAWDALRLTLRAALWTFLPCVLLSYLTVLVLGPLGVPDAVIARTGECLLGRVPSLLLFPLFLTLKTFLQAWGRTRPAVVGALVANAVNLVACNLLVRGDPFLASLGLPPLGLPRLGAFGAGLASSLGSLVLTLALVPAVLSLRPGVAPPAVSRTDQIGIQSLATGPLTLGRVLSLGLPVGLGMIAEIGVFSLVSLLTGRFGPAISSAHQVAFGLASFTFMGALGVSGATAVRVGTAIGAGRSPRRVGLLGIGVGACGMSLGALAFALVPGPLVRLFSDDPQVVEVGITLLRMAAVFQLFDGTQVVASGALRGAGDTRFPFLLNVGAHWFVGFPLALWLGLRTPLGIRGLWWGLTAGLISIAIALTSRFLVLSSRPIARV